VQLFCNKNNIYLPVKADCQKITSSTLATLETNDNDYNNRKKTVQQQAQNKCPVYILYTVLQLYGRTSIRRFVIVTQPVLFLGQ